MSLWLPHPRACGGSIRGAEKVFRGARPPPDCNGKAGGEGAPEGGIDCFLGVQGGAASLLRGAVEAGYPETRTRFFASSEEAAQFLADFVTPGDLLLVKGSRGVHMERIVEALKSGHAPAATLADAGATGPAPKECG